MNELQIFSNPEFGAVRALTLDDEPWAVGKDVATALGYKNVRDAIIRHVDDEDRGVSCFTTPSGNQQMTIINESGLYSLILSSKLPGAKRFKRWITSEVLPALRKTGHYEMPQPAPAEELPPPPGLGPNDYIRAASIIASCQKGRLPAVITLLARSGLDMSEIDTMDARGGVTQTAEEFDANDEALILEFVRRKVPEDWTQWSIDRRRAYWSGEIEVDPSELVPRSRISAIEVWSEFYNRPPKACTSRQSRAINRVLQTLGWTHTTVRVGAGYGAVHGFINTEN